MWERQELKIFLEADGPLGSVHAWQSLQPLQGSLLEGMARLPKQLLGEHPLQHALSLS